MRKARRTKVRGWRWRHNPLRRHSDAVEAWIVLATWSAAVTAGAAAGVVGAYAVDGAVDRDRAGRLPVSAVLLEKAPDKVHDVVTGMRYDRVKAPVRWTDANGTVRTAEASVKAGAAAGTTVPAWTDGHGRLVAAPVSGSEAVARVSLAGTGAAAIGALVVLGGGRVVRLRLERRATESWGEEWDRVGPQWGRKTG